MSSDGAKNYVGQALELRHRLPRLFARVVAGEVAVWRARRVAEHTIDLPVQGAGFVDRHLASCAHKVGMAQLERTVADARLRFDPAEAERMAANAVEKRCFDLGLDDLGMDGTVQVHGCLSLTDALDLEEAIRQGARRQVELGSTEALPVRRAKAAGDLGRTQLALNLDAGHDDSADTRTAPGPGRTVVIYAHVSDTAVAGLNSAGAGSGLAGSGLAGSGLAGIDNTGGDVLVAEVGSWCGQATKVVIKPVIDLGACEPVDAYPVPARTQEVVDLRDRHCVFPYCTRPARRCDHDHVTEWPQGPTCACNLAPLCRRHHRTKTHSPWTYEAIDDGVYLWHSPHGLRFRRDRIGTLDLTDT